MTCSLTCLLQKKERLKSCLRTSSSGFMALKQKRDKPNTKRQKCSFHENLFSNYADNTV